MAAITIHAFLRYSWHTAVTYQCDKSHETCSRFSILRSQGVLNVMHVLNLEIVFNADIRHFCQSMLFLPPPPPLKNSFGRPQYCHWLQEFQISRASFNHVCVVVFLWINLFCIKETLFKWTSESNHGDYAADLFLILCGDRDGTCTFPSRVSFAPPPFLPHCWPEYVYFQLIAWCFTTSAYN